MGSFEEVSRRNEVILREVLEQAAEEPGDLLGDAFAAGMDLEAIEAAGITAIEPLLEAAAREDLAALHRAGIFVLFGWGVTADHDDTAATCCGSPRRGWGYRTASPTSTTRRRSCGRRTSSTSPPSCATRASSGDGAAVLAFETRLAELHWRAEERRDTDRTHNRYDRAQLVALATGLDGYLSALGAGPPNGQRREPDAARGLQAVLAETALRHAARTSRSTSSRRSPTRCPSSSTTRTSRSTAA